MEMAGQRRMEKTDASKRPEEQGASSSRTGDSNVHRWDDTPRPQGGEPGKPESGKQGSEAARLSGNPEAYEAGDHNTLPSLAKLPGFDAKLKQIQRDIPVKTIETAEKMLDITIGLNTEISPDALQEAYIETERAMQNLGSEVEKAEREIEVIQTELGQVQEDLPGEMKHALREERAKLDSLAEQKEKLSKATPEEIEEGLKQIPEGQREGLQQIMEASSRIIREQREELDKEEIELQKMQEEFDAATSLEKEKLKKALKNKREIFEELSKTVQSLEEMEQLFTGVMGQGRPSAPGHPEQGGRS